MARVLLVEDSDICAMVFRRALEKAGYDVVVATTVSDACDKASTQTFDAALVDTQLPDGDGATIPLPCPRVMMSADSAPGIITKSSGAAPLVDAVRNLIARPHEPPPY
ncbi:response regulator transcription factor [Paraliomyxa miuraensis]|uniref:response regulator transcription factor n=1 Tax=Paraliomyxa miuraensis TaxID=376150 RepID=UPI002252EE7D|nr:response regulator [Paraliomyxa miuraensis]